MSRTILIDADIPIYMVSAKNEIPIHWGDGLWTLHSFEEQTLNDFDYFIEDLAEKLKADRVVLTVSDKVNFRLSILPTYKHNRSDKREPMLRFLVKEHALENYECFKRPGLEGDDVLGILSTSNRIIKGEKIIVSIDKDMRTIPGLILNWHHAEYAVNTGHLAAHSDAVYEITEAQADYFHRLQTLTGDTTDGYTGCPGIGFQTADQILSDQPHIVVPEEHTISRGKRKGEQGVKWVKHYGDYTPWDTIVSYFAKAGFGEEEALRQARVARICRNTDYDFKKKEVIPWVPEQMRGVKKD